MCIDLDTERRIKENDLKYIVQGSMNNGMQTRLEIRAKIAHCKGTVCLFVIILHSATGGHGISHTYFLPASSVT